MKDIYKIIWSDEALNNLREIIDYLSNRWTEKEIGKFAQLLDHQLKLILENPTLFTECDKPRGIRKSIYQNKLPYIISLKDMIYI